MFHTASFDMLFRGTSALPGRLVARSVSRHLIFSTTATVISGIEVKASAEWMARRLTAAGMRPISNVVDITNYVMLLTGHPLHAFDLDRVAGGRLNVRWATDGERITTLDGQTRAQSITLWEKEAGLRLSRSSRAPLTVRSQSRQQGWPAVVQC